MRLSNGRPYLAIPGPSVMPDRVLQAMQRPAPNIYTGALVEMVNGMIPELKAIARTSGNVAIYITNGHGTWEAALTNVLSRGDKVLVLATGRFGVNWAGAAGSLGADVEMVDFGLRGTVDLDRVADILARDKSHEIKAVLATHVDTATSVLNDISAIRGALDAAGHPALLMADCIASLGCDRFEMDAWGVDVMIAASQKGLMTPPGLGFVFFNDRADKAHATANCVTPYWDWSARAKPEEFYQYFDGTAPTHHLYALREALSMIREEGLENVWARHATLARAYWAALDAWGQDGQIEMNIQEPELRSHAVTTVRIPAPLGTALRDWVEQNCGVTLGIGLGMAAAGDPAWHGFFRIGHMGHLNAHMVMGVIGAVEAGLIALDVPFGSSGTAAAARVIAGR